MSLRETGVTIAHADAEILGRRTAELTLQVLDEFVGLPEGICARSRADGGLKPDVHDQEDSRPGIKNGPRYFRLWGSATNSKIMRDMDDADSLVACFVTQYLQDGAFLGRQYIDRDVVQETIPQYILKKNERNVRSQVVISSYESLSFCC
jgi:hypothetical protein